MQDEWMDGSVHLRLKLKITFRDMKKRRIIHVLINISEHILHVFTFVLWNVLQHVWYPDKAESKRLIEDVVSILLQPSFVCMVPLCYDAVWALTELTKQYFRWVISSFKE